MNEKKNNRERDLLSRESKNENFFFTKHSKHKNTKENWKFKQKLEQNALM